jgi:hypothetical protein
MTTINLIPHDGGPCPVEGDCIGKYRNGGITLSKAQYEWEWKGRGKHNTDIIAYCPIEIKEGE